MRHTLLLIHGFPLDATLWAANTNALRTAANVIAPDLRGFGSHASNDVCVSMEQYAHDLHALVEERRAERVVLCGLSMGGYIAMAFVERWPHLVEGLVLCNTRSTADSEEAKAGRETTATDALQKGMGVIARAMAPKVLGQVSRQDPDRVAQVEAMIARQAPTAAAAAARGMAIRPDRTHVLRDFHLPALVITGDQDELMPLPTSQAMVDALPRGHLQVLKNAGHLSNLESPAAFNAAIHGYLAAL